MLHLVLCSYGQDQIHFVSIGFQNHMFPTCLSKVDALCCNLICLQSPKIQHVNRKKNNYENDKYSVMHYRQQQQQRPFCLFVVLLDYYKIFKFCLTFRFPLQKLFSKTLKLSSENQNVRQNLNIL